MVTKGRISWCIRPLLSICLIFYYILPFMNILMTPFPGYCEGAAVDGGMQVTLRHTDFLSCEHRPRSELLDHMIVLFSFLLRKLHAAFHNVCTNLHLTCSLPGFPCLHMLSFPLYKFLFLHIYFFTFFFFPKDCTGIQQLYIFIGYHTIFRYTYLAPQPFFISSW